MNMKKVLALIFAAVFCLGSTACSTDSLLESSESSTPASSRDTSAEKRDFTAEELADLYKSDKEAAEEYENQKITITGICSYVSLFDKIHMDCGAISKSVVCELEDSDDPQLDQLKKGDVVTVEGILDNGFADIELEDCEILNIEKAESNTEASVSSADESTSFTPKPTATTKPTIKPTANPTPKPTPQPTEEPASQSNVVWLSRTGEKYHNNPNCGNMKTPIESTLDEAIASGREPCKKCYG